MKNKASRPFKYFGIILLCTIIAAIWWIAANWHPTTTIFHRGFRAFESGKHERAIRLFTRWIKSEGPSDAVYLYRGASFLALGKYAEAVRDYSSGIDLIESELSHRESDPEAMMWNKLTLAELYIWRGAAHYHMFLHEQAYNDLTKAIALRPERPRAYYFRSYVHTEAGRLNEALADLEMAKTVYPDRYELFALESDFPDLVQVEMVVLQEWIAEKTGHDADATTLHLHR
jgi:tetratricopeptide (TPR) repeat protein